MDVLNVFSNLCSRFPLTAIPWLYHLFTVKHPWLWRAFYRMTDTPTKFALGEWLAQPFLQPGLQRYLANWQPDVVVLAFPALGHSISRALATIGSTAPIVTVVTDLVTIHASWICNDITAYIVATPAAADACAAAGIPKERIRCFGLPVPSEFMQPCSDRAELRRHLGLDTDAPTVLLMGGGEGSGGLESPVYALADACQTTQIVVITGRNHALHHRLASRRLAVPCTVLGYVSNVGDWMRASDLIITKAGPATVMEALYTGVPMILIGSLPQEVGTVRYIMEHGAARVASDASEVVTTVTELLSHPDQMEVIRRNGEILRQVNAAHDIVAFILEVASHGGPAIDVEGSE